jgi:hypothetical protein
MRTRVLKAALWAWISAAIPVAAVEELVDDFMDANLPGTLLCVPTAPKPECPVNSFNLGVFVASSSNMATDTGLSGVLGGSRKLTVSVGTCTFCGMGPFDDRVVAGADPAPMGLFCFNSTASADGSFELLYDANGAGLGASLSFADGIRVQIVNIDAASFPFAVTITLKSGPNSAQATQTVPNSPPLPTDVDLDFPFASFTGIGGIDLDDLSSITVAVDPATAADLQILRIETYGTPENEIGGDCENGVDDDNDGVIDCEDPDCVGQSPACAAPAPALSGAATALLFSLLVSVGGLGIVRLRRRVRRAPGTV